MAKKAKTFSTFEPIIPPGTPSKNFRTYSFGPGDDAGFDQWVRTNNPGNQQFSLPASITGPKYVIRVQGSRVVRRKLGIALRVEHEPAEYDCQYNV